MTRRLLAASAVLFAGSLAAPVAGNASVAFFLHPVVAVIATIAPIKAANIPNHIGNIQ